MVIILLDGQERKVRLGSNVRGLRISSVTFETQDSVDLKEVNPLITLRWFGTLANAHTRNSEVSALGLLTRLIHLQKNHDN